MPSEKVSDKRGGPIYRSHCVCKWAMQCWVVIRFHTVTQDETFFYVEVEVIKKKRLRALYERNWNRHASRGCHLSHVVLRCYSSSFTFLARSFPRQTLMSAFWTSHTNPGLCGFLAETCKNATIYPKTFKKFHGFFKKQDWFIGLECLDVFDIFLSTLSSTPR